MDRSPLDNPPLLQEGLDAEPRFRSSIAHNGASLLDKLTLRFKSDEDLAERLREGYNDAMTVLFERHSALVYRVARRVVQESGEAEEVVQQVFLDVYRSIHQYDAQKGPVKSWLLMFAYQRALNRKRHLTSRFFYSTDELSDALPQLFAGAAKQLPFHLNTAEAACLSKKCSP
jgi:DNA-directed RNA polymerase specialized sigma24 family protein